MRQTDTKTKIFFAAVELFSESGYKNVSMRDLAQKIDIKPASIYNHYESKEKILDALLDYYLERMDQFYSELNEFHFKISADSELEDVLEQLLLSYRVEERELMFHLTRIVHHEQFSSPKAADALVGGGYRKYMEEHVKFFDRLSEAGLVTGTEHNHMYGELFARISLTFATQFLHPDIPPTLKTQAELYHFVIPLVVNYEKAKKLAQ